MKINDRVYGREKVDEKILIDLINCKSTQRLKGLSQYGFPDEFYHEKGYSRFEHSLGVMIFLRKHNTDIEEQIAGLIHDVSHTAFSHVIDWAIGNPEKEDFQDNNHLEIIKNSEIPKILDSYGFDYKRISNLNNFSLLEKEAPSLCVDRVDYTLREIAVGGDMKTAKRFFSFLDSKNGNLFFKDKSVAEIFGRKYAELNREHWAGIEARTRYYLLANILKRAFNKGFISFGDLYKTDSDLIKFLYNTKDIKIISDLNFLKNKKIAVSLERGNGIYLRKKYRWIDPEVLNNGKIKRLSELSEEYNLFLKKEKIFLENNCYSKLLK